MWNWILLTLMKTTAAYSLFVPHTTDSFFSVFPSAIWCKVSKLLMCYKYQLTKCCLEGILGFTVSSSFLKVMKLIKDQIAKICHEFHRCWRWLHHDCSWGFHVRFCFNETIWRLNSKRVRSYCFLEPLLWH